MSQQSGMGPDIYRLAGVSMFPLTAPLCAGVQQCELLQTGDIAAFINERGQLTFHRVIDVHPDHYLVRGDTNRFADAPVPRSAVIGRVQHIQLGALIMRFPEHGLLGDAMRQAGLTWGKTAPWLRAVVRRCRRFTAQQRV